MPRVMVEVVPDEARIRACRAGTADPEDAACVGVAIDVLRATTTLTVARRNGAVGVMPFAETSQALAYRAAHPTALACGERDGSIVAGFDLGNSPFEYTCERVAGRILAFASTNGSRAMLSQQGCAIRLLGAFVNASAVVRACTAATFVRLTCAGDRGQRSNEDLACAGWIAAALVKQGFQPYGSEVAVALASAPVGSDAVRLAVEGSFHAGILASMGSEYQRDVAFCATLDAVPSCEAW